MLISPLCRAVVCVSSVAPKINNYDKLCINIYKIQIFFLNASVNSCDFKYILVYNS